MDRPLLMWTPFATPELVAWDSLRIVVILGGFTLIAASLYITAATHLPARWLLLASTIAFCVAAVGTEIQHLGDHATYRLFANLVGVVVGLWGAWLARKEP